MAYDEDLIKNPKGGMPRLIEIMRALRDPDAGCPWDIEQTFETIAPYTVEEAYEVADAIERKIGPNFVVSWGICYCSRSITRKWPRKQAV